MHVPQFFRKPAFWCVALVTLVVFAVIFLASPASYPVRRAYCWVPMVFNSPDKMEPAPFWHYGEVPKELNASYLIAHAGAAIENNTYTNSREALENAKKLGYRFVELDLQVLADGTIVGSHDVPPADLQSWEAFSAHPIKEKFTPIALPEIRDFFRSNPDMWFVTDKISKKEDLEKLLEVWGGDHGHLVVEVFTPRQWLDARKLGIRLPALHVERGWELKALRFFNIPVATCRVETLKRYPKEAEEYLKAGGSLLVFTENDPIAARQNLSRRATLIYTDYLVPAPNSSASGISVGNGSADSENKSAFSS